MTNILITGVGSDVGQGIIKALRLTNFKYRLIGTDSIAFSAGLFRCDKGYVVPCASEKMFISRIIEICNKEKIDIILIGVDAEISVFSANKALIEKETKSIVVVSPKNIIEISQDKLKTSEFLKKNKLNFPNTISGNSKLIIKQFVKKYGFPLFIKPRKGSGSKEIYKINNLLDLEYAIKNVIDPIIQEYLKPSDQEYTSSVFFTKESEIKGIIVMKRELAKTGSTYRATIKEYTEVKIEVEKIAEVLGKMGAIGSINIQQRLTSRGPVTFEINPRFSGTTSFKAMLGFNEPENVIKNFLFDQKIKKMTYMKNMIIMRYWDEVCVPSKELKRLEQNGCLNESESKIFNLL